MASTESFESLLSSRLLDVPDYQRGYAWEATQLAEFWEDLELIGEKGRHYTGTVVLRELGNSVHDEDREVPLEHFHVVDGQQRITTCTLLLDRIFDRLDAMNDDEIPSARRRMLTATVAGVKRPKLQLGADISGYWHQVILDGRPNVAGARLAAEHRLTRAAEYFESKLEEQRQELPDPMAYRSWLRRLAGKITGSLQFTVYVVDDDSEVGVIFETLNQRGKDLSELEKTKNYLLYLASKLDPGPRDALSSTVNSCWKTIFTNLGAAQLGANHEDQLLRAHWLATENPRPSEWLKAKSIKARFHRRRYLDDRTLIFDEISQYARSLSDASLAYRDIVTENQESFAAYDADTPSVRKASRQLRQAGVVALFAPLLIAARLRFPDNGAAYGALVDICERYSVRVFLIAERRGNAGAARLYSLAHRLHHGGDLTATIDSVTERIRYFAGDNAVHEELLNTTRNWYAKAGHKYFLYQYELHLLAGAVPVLGFEHFTRGEFRASTTEHILPQNPTGSSWRAFTPKNRERYTHSLGNLVLTNDNNAYSNHSFTRKRDGLETNDARTPCYAKSALKQEQELAALAEWTPAELATRQERLTTWALERWKITTAAAEDRPLPDGEAVADIVEDAAEDADPMLTDIENGAPDTESDAS